jgi:hypothetical protein
LFIRSLNTIGSQQEISSTRAITYLMKLPNHITNVYFSTIPWYNLSMLILEHEKSLDDICEDDKTFEFFNLDKM